MYSYLITALQSGQKFLCVYAHCGLCAKCVRAQAVFTHTHTHTHTHTRGFRYRIRTAP
jgi:hypothetical protein